MTKPMTKPDLMAELVRLTDKFRHDDSLTSDESQALAQRIDAIHAELEAALRDGARYRWLRESEAMLWKDGDSHPVDFDLDTAIDAQMHNSAREW